MTHLDHDLLERFARGDLDENQLAYVLEHLATCEACAAAGRGRAASDIAALRQDLAPRPPRSLAPLGMTLAAAAAIAILLLFLLLRQPAKRDAIPPAPKDPPRVATTTTPVIAHAYADPAWERLVAETRQRGNLPQAPEAEELRRAADVVRGSGGVLAKVHPSGVVIDDVRPAFIWPAQDADATYVVSVYEEDQKIAQSPPRKTPTWRPNRDLPRGRTLTWQVEWMRGNALQTIPQPPAPPALFRIITEAQQREIERARSLHPNDHLLQAVLYARSGMRSEALDALRRSTDPAVKRILDHETSSPP